ncbi:MAG: SPASM domain-containing protein [Legionella sp.]|nr:SPASM domain-containing protein [Legionella sp.]
MTLSYFIFRQYDQVLLKFLLDKYRTETKEYTIYDSCNGITDYKRTIDSSCWKLYSSSTVCWNGDVVPCCYDAYAKVHLGNMTEGFGKVWNGEEYQAFREQIFTEKRKFHLCMNCNSRENRVHQRIAIPESF